MSSSPELIVRRISAQATIPMRLLTVRAGKSRDEATLEGDDLDTTQHYGIFDQQDNLLGSVSMLARESSHSSLAPAFQLRAMGTHPDTQGQGIGRLLVEGVIEQLREQGCALIWCNARKHVLGFYERCGFEIVGDEFEVGSYGPHRVGLLAL